MARRSIAPRVAAARRLPWHVSIAEAPGGHGAALDALLAWCRRLPFEAWFWPLPGNAWGFEDRQTAEAFAAKARVLLGDGVSVRDSRATGELPWRSR